jgi:hypothetical protein
MTNDSTALRAPAVAARPDARPEPRASLKRSWAGRPLPFHPLLLAVYPVLFLYGQNVGELTLGDLVTPLVAILAATVVALVVGAYVLRDSRRAALVVSALAAFLLLYGHLSGVLAPLGVRAGFQQIGWAVVLVGVVVLAIRLRPDRLANVTRALNLVAAVLVAFALVTIVPAEAQRLGRSTAAAATIEGASGPGRDIYYLVFDRYGSARSLDLLYDIDDRPFLDGLRDRGFQVAPDSHANYVKTTLSLAATLNLDYLDDLVAVQDPASDDHGPIYERLSNHAVGRFLRERGYRYIHVGSNYGPTESSAIADRNLRSGGPSDFLASLYDTSALPFIARRLGLSSAAPDRERRYTVGKFQLDTLDQLAGEPGPSFVYAHLLLPHPPYVFARDGSFVTDALDTGRSQRDGYAEQLAYLQTRINALVDRLLARPEGERPIIILQADEGPYPRNYARNTVEYDWATASPEELEIKYGILNAMYLPGAEAPDLPPTVSAVNTFRLILGAYFGADLPLLPDRSYTSAGKFRPYDLTEITDRLPPPGPAAGS